MIPRPKRSHLDTKIIEQGLDNYRKYTCIKCKTEIATWFYMSAMYCDDCIVRGCSCQLDEEGNVLYGDDGKLLPCCDYSYFEEGLEK